MLRLPFLFLLVCDTINPVIRAVPVFEKEHAVHPWMKPMMQCPRVHRESFEWRVAGAMNRAAGETIVRLFSPN